MKLFNESNLSTQPNLTLEEFCSSNDAIFFTTREVHDKMNLAFESFYTISEISKDLNEKQNEQKDFHIYKLAIESSYVNLGYSHNRAKSLADELEFNREISFEGLTDTVGRIVKKAIDFIAFLHDKVEQGWNNTIRLLPLIRSEISDAEKSVYALGGKSIGNMTIPDKIFNSFYVEKGEVLTPQQVLKILDNHLDTLNTIKDFRDAISDVGDYDMDRLPSLFRKAKTQEDLDEDSMYRNSVEKIKKMVDLSNKSNKVLLGEGRVLSVEFDEEALDSYLFQRATITIDMNKSPIGYKVRNAQTATRSDGEKILKTLKELAEKTKYFTDYHMHMAKHISGEYRNLFKSFIAGLATIAIGVVMPPAALITYAIHLYYYFYMLYDTIMQWIILFYTKFSNVTYRAMSAACAYLKAST